ncbi:MAG TPA: hypothetical protein VK507_14685 [Iamia sp.]|nr:hypothetical protein [Iamia sp.]
MLALCRALLRRTIREYRWRLVVVPAALGLGVVLLSLVATRFTGGFTPATRRSLEGFAESFLGSTSTSAVAVAFVLFQMPTIVLLFSSATASSIAQNLVGDELRRGSLEVLLTAPVSRPKVVGSLLGTTVALATTSFAVFAGTALGSAVVALRLIDAPPVDLPTRYWLLVGPLPFAVVILSAALSLLVAVRFPIVGELRAGTLNVSQTLATMPALALLLYLTARPGLPSTGLLVVTSVLALTGAAAAWIYARSQLPKVIFR